MEKPLMTGSFQNQHTHSAEVRRAAATSPPLEIRRPQFKVKKGVVAQVEHNQRSGGEVGIFCQCGGPGSLVKVLPCGCYSLCLNCCQQQKSCPKCGAKVTDSFPSFKRVETAM